MDSLPLKPLQAKLCLMGRLRVGSPSDSRDCSALLYQLLSGSYLLDGEFRTRGPPKGRVQYSNLIQHWNGSQHAQSATLNITHCVKLLIRALNNNSSL